MKRFLAAAAFLLVGGGTASADYVLLKINLNQLNLLPAAGMAGAGQMGGAGGGVPGMPPGPGGMPFPGGGKGGPGGMPQPGMPQPGGAQGGAGMVGGAPAPAPIDAANLFPDDPSARYITALVEMNNFKFAGKTAYGTLLSAETHYSPGKYVWLPLSQQFPLVGAKRVIADSFINEFNLKFTKEKKDKNIETMLNLARWTLQRGYHKKFHDVMDEAIKIDDKHAIVKRYVRVKKSLEAPLKTQDPFQRELIDQLTREGYKEHVSKKGHYSIYSPNLEDPTMDATVKRRLDLFENTLDTFYYWFALQKNLAAQPALPKYRLTAIVTGSNDDFTSRHAQWGSLPRVADGFTPQRDSVVVMSAKSRIDDPNYAELVSLINNKLSDANSKLQQMGFKIALTQENLLSGEINTNKASGGIAVYVGVAQTAVLLAKSLQEQSERHTITNEGTRQLLVASGMFPRNVQVPDWVIEGLAALFEVPVGGAYSTVGDRSCIHLISFKHHRATNPDFTNPAEVLSSVISDTYFQKAKRLTREFQDTRDAKEKRQQKVSWEVARCTSWAFIYYLAQNHKLDYVFNYGKELDKLPRDMDFSSPVMQGCFAKAFDMVDQVNPPMIEDYKLKNMADHWFQVMEANLDNSDLQKFLAKEREKQDPTAPPTIASNPTIPNGTAPNPNPNPNPPQPGNTDLTGTTWGGKETLPGYGPLSFRFMGNGQVTMTDKDGVQQGKYMQQGAAIALQFVNGSVIYNGSINGQTMQGTASNGKNNWSWNLTNGAQPTQGLNPQMNQPQGPMPPAPMPPRPKKKF